MVSRSEFCIRSKLFPKRALDPNLCTILGKIKPVTGGNRPKPSCPAPYRSAELPCLPSYKGFVPVVQRIQKATGRDRKVKGLQLGYESRCAKPHAFDVMLGAQLGVGAYRALVEEGLNGVMVSTTGQLELCYVPFEELVNPENLVTTVRYIKPGSDFHRLARFMETYVNE